MNEVIIILKDELKERIEIIFKEMLRLKKCEGYTNLDYNTENGLRRGFIHATEKAGFTKYEDIQEEFRKVLK